MRKKSDVFTSVRGVASSIALALLRTMIHKWLWVGKTKDRFLLDATKKKSQDAPVQVVLSVLANSDTVSAICYELRDKSGRILQLASTTYSLLLLKLGFQGRNIEFNIAMTGPPLLYLLLICYVRTIVRPTRNFQSSTNR